MRQYWGYQGSILVGQDWFGTRVQLGIEGNGQIVKTELDIVEATKLAEAILEEVEAVRAQISSEEVPV